MNKARNITEETQKKDAERKARLAEQLRANLRRRKEQSRSRTDDTKKSGES